MGQSYVFPPRRRRSAAVGNREVRRAALRPRLKARRRSAAESETFDQICYFF
jgi:hypothetical protein